MDHETLQKAERVGEIAQDLFNMYLEKTWTHDIDISKIDYQDGRPTQIMVTEADGYEAGPGRETLNESVGGGWYVLLPFPLRVHQGAKAAILVHGNSIRQFVVMTNAVRFLFEDLVNDPIADIKEVTHTPSSKLQRIVHHVSSDEKPINLATQPYPDDKHIGVFEITLYTGFKVALSLTGMQYTDLHKPVRPWEEYMSIYGTPNGPILTRTPNGTARRQHDKLLGSMTRLSHLHSDQVGLKQMEECIRRSQVINQVRRLVMMISPHPWAGFKQHFVALFNALLSEIITLSSPAQLPSTSSPLLSLAHPSFLQDSIFYKHKRHMRFYDYGAVLAQNFNWDQMKDIAKSKAMGFERQKEARAVLGNKTVVAPWADGRLFFLQNETLHGKVMENGLAKENPHFDGLRKAY